MDENSKARRLEEIRQKLKTSLVEQLSLEDVDPAEIEDDEPLFEEGLSLDSLDAVEIVVILQRQFGINMQDADMNRDVFESVNTLAEYIYNHADS